jgi:hypothetical protein
MRLAPRLRSSDVARKRDVERPYPPEYVSAETLAYLLDYSRSTVQGSVRPGVPRASRGGLTCSFGRRT